MCMYIRIKIYIKARKNIYKEVHSLFSRKGYFCTADFFVFSRIIIIIKKIASHFLYKSSLIHRTSKV